MLVVSFVPAISLADNWPQWMGPKRDNVWRETGLWRSFPKAGREWCGDNRWRAGTRGRPSAMAVCSSPIMSTDSNVKIDNFDRKEFTGIERVLCLDAATGKERWHHDYPVKYTISYPAGPRCTPIIDGDRLYTLGAEGNLICFKAESGDSRVAEGSCRRNTRRRRRCGAMRPSADRRQQADLLAGGDGTHAVALDKNTGKEIWRSSTSPEQGYSPPTIIKVGDKRQLLLARPNALTAVDPETGKEIWSVPYEATSGSIIMSPVHSGKYVYLGGYSKKSLLVELADDGRRPKSCGATRPSTAFRPSTCSRL